MTPARKGRGKAPMSRPKVLGLTTAQCEGFGGSCSASTDCDLSSNVFRGRCDNSTSGCCISKDDVCASRNGTCISLAECEADSDSHASRLGCSSDDVVCCVADRNGRRMGPGGRHGGRRQGQWNIWSSSVVYNDNWIWLTNSMPTNSWCQLVYQFKVTSCLWNECLALVYLWVKCSFRPSSVLSTWIFKESWVFLIHFFWHALEIICI